MDSNLRLPCRAHLDLIPMRLDLRPENRSGSRQISTQDTLPEPRVGKMPARANPAHAAPSPFRDHLCLNAHVARSCYRPGTAVCLRLPPEHSFQQPMIRLLISGDRNKKHPLTHPLCLFAVRHRLHRDSLASPLGPFMVELFAFLFFAGYPKAAWTIGMVGVTHS